MELKGLVVGSPHIENILSGMKTWEMRSTNASYRGWVALIKKGSGTILGVAKLVAAKGPLSSSELAISKGNHLMTDARLRDPSAAKYHFAWVLESARVLPCPVAYKHPAGAVIWVALDELVKEEVSRLAQLAP